MSRRRIFRFLFIPTEGEAIVLIAIWAISLPLATVLLLGYKLTLIGKVITVLIGLIGTGLFVLLGETLIEDLVKAILMLGLAGTFWALDQRAIFIFIATAVMVAIGIPANLLFKKLQKLDNKGA